MKNCILVFLLIFSFSFNNYSSAFPTNEDPVMLKTSEDQRKWEKLGTRQVNFKAERDEIAVTAQDGTFSALKLKVNNAGINLTKMIVHFQNGQKQDVNIRQNIPADGESRVIDLKGKKRIIKKVVFYYDTKRRASRRATVVLFGRH